MTWYAWTFVGLLVFDAGARFALVGRPRKPLTGGEVLGHTIYTGLLVWAIIALAGGA